MVDAVTTGEGAAGRREREAPAARPEVVEGFALVRVDVLHHGREGGGLQDVPGAPADAARADLPVAQHAAQWTEVAPDPVTARAE
nr:hypothetical protein GCM10020092_069560 [Actinoplanes digitatis]